MESMSTSLKKVRESQGYSRDEIARSTRIPLHYIEFLEGEDVRAGLSDPLYLVPFLRTYADFLGLDASKTVSQYLVDLPRSSAPTPARPKPWPARWVGAVVVLALIAAVAGVMLRRQHVPSEDSPATVSLRDFPPSIEELTAPLPALRTASAVGSTSPANVVPPVAPPPVPPAAGSFRGETPPALAPRLQIRAKEATWLRITADDNPPEELLLEPGDRIERSAKSALVLTVGNAGGVELVLNGHTLPPLGASGEVIRNLRLPSQRSSPDASVPAGPVAAGDVTP